MTQVFARISALYLFLMFLFLSRRGKRSVGPTHALPLRGTGRGLLLAFLISSLTILLGLLKAHSQTTVTGFIRPVVDDYLPLKWQVLGPFGEYYGDLGGYHSGEDWNLVGGSADADFGKPVYAIASGTVAKVFNLGALGYLVALRHTGIFTIPGKSATINGQSYSYRTETVNSIYSVYMHINNIAVDSGNVVQQGKVLGYIMNPGGGPHLHFEIRHPNAANSASWSLVGSTSNWATNAQGERTGTYRNLQAMVDAGMRHPSEFITTNSGQPPSVAPTVVGVTPNPVTGSNDRQWITINGSGFVSGLTVTLRTGGQRFPIPSDRTDFVSSTQVKVFVNVTVDPASWTAQVTNPNGTASNEFGFNVVAPGTSSQPSQSLSASLTANPSSGFAPLNVTLTASTSGTATGTINYTFWWDCDNPSNSVGDVVKAGKPYDLKFDGVHDNPKVVSHIYSSPGTYTAKVIVERGSAAPVERRMSITVTSPNKPPTAPSNLRAVEVSPSQIDLLWEDNSADETAFSIERRAGNENFSDLITVGVNKTQFSDLRVTSGVTYAYRVRALNSSGFSGYSNEASATLGATKKPDLVVTKITRL